jgi:hypothetical protein
MSADAIITYKDQTITLKNATVTQLPSRDESNMTPEELDEAKRLLDAIIEKYPGEAYRAFNRAHPAGGSFYFLPDGSLGFQNAPIRPRGVIATLSPKN